MKRPASPAILPLLLAGLLGACGDSGSGSPTDPTGFDLPDVVEYRGVYTDASDCIDPGAGSWPMTIWLHGYVRSTREVRVSLRFGTGGSRDRADHYFLGTVTDDGVVEAVGVDSKFEDVDDQYTLRATATPQVLTGRMYDHCGDGTADIWEFTLSRHE